MTAAPGRPRQKRCIRGHLLTPDATGSRRCKICDRVRAALRYQRIRANPDAWTARKARINQQRPRAREGLPRRKRCVECGVNWSDPPSRLCPGCEAYREHAT